jgi:hypothetical protein
MNSKQLALLTAAALLALTVGSTVGQDLQTAPLLFDDFQAADSAFINVAADTLTRYLKHTALGLSYEKASTIISALMSSATAEHIAISHSKASARGKLQ